MQSVIKPKYRRKEAKLSSVYSRHLITRSIVLPLNNIGKDINTVLERVISDKFEGVCVVEGYIKPKSSKLITYSSGLIVRGNKISFEVVFECDMCFPVENMLLSCVAKNITKAGIRAESADEFPSPVVVFIAKDHHYNNSDFSEIKEGDVFTTRVIGQRFELNDKYVSIIGEVVKTSDTNKVKSKPRLVIQDE
jgi:DNA-directed RNA polymerase subunit E'/Rpb7